MDGSAKKEIGRNSAHRREHERLSEALRLRNKTLEEPLLIMFDLCEFAESVHRAGAVGAR